MNINISGMVTPMVSSLESNYHYCSNLVYNNDRLSTILFDGGYASVDEEDGIVMHFYVKDHLGSNRLVVDGNGNIEEVNHYYPFGALMGDRCGVSRNKYKYIGKELDTMYGWNMQEHEARWYDPVVGRIHIDDELDYIQRSYRVRSNGTQHFWIERRSLLGHSIKNFYRSDAELILDKAQLLNKKSQSLFIQNNKYPF